MNKVFAWTTLIACCVTMLVSMPTSSNETKAAEPQAADAKTTETQNGSQSGSKNAAQHDEATPPPIAALKEKAKPSNVHSGACLVDEKSLEDFRAVKEAQANREKELTLRDEELKRREAAIDTEIKKLESVRDEVNKLKGAFRRENEEKVNKLVETFETMSPKSASALLGSIDENLAIAAMTKMSTPKLAKLLNLMEPGKSARLSEGLVGIAHARLPASEQKGEEQRVANSGNKQDAGLSKPSTGSGK